MCKHSYPIRYEKIVKTVTLWAALVVNLQCHVWFFHSTSGHKHIPTHTHTPIATEREAVCPGVPVQFFGGAWQSPTREYGPSN